MAFCFRLRLHGQGAFQVAGMSKGTGTSFDLDRAPTRGEAAVMLVRLYGAEADAKVDAFRRRQNIFPFTDCKTTLLPLRGMAIVCQGLDQGSSATQLHSRRRRVTPNSTAHLLCCAPWATATLTSYADALTFAQSKGIYSPRNLYRQIPAATTWLPGTYQALATDLRTAAITCWPALSAAAPSTRQPPDMTAKIETYRADDEIHGGWRPARWTPT